MYCHGVEIKFKNLPTINCYFGTQNIESMTIFKLFAKPSKFLQKEILEIHDQAWLVACSSEQGRAASGQSLEQQALQDQELEK
jgi:hypothetical protein